MWLGYRKKVVPRIDFALYIFVKGFFDALNVNNS